MELDEVEKAPQPPPTRARSTRSRSASVQPATRSQSRAGTQSSRAPRKAANQAAPLFLLDSDEDEDEDGSMTLPSTTETLRSRTTAKRKRATAAAPAPPAPRPAASGKPRRMTTRSKAQAPTLRTSSPGSDPSDHTVVLTPPRRQTRAATKRAQSNKQAELGVGMAGATRAAKRRRME